MLVVEAVEEEEEEEVVVVAMMEGSYDKLRSLIGPCVPVGVAPRVTSGVHHPTAVDTSVAELSGRLCGDPC